MGVVLLVGDVGGTHARFAVAALRDGQIEIEQHEVLHGDDFETFEDALRHYLGKSGVRPDAACLAIAGPVLQGRGNLTNRYWSVSEREVSELFSIPDVCVVNDFVAMARSVPELGSDAFEILFEGAPVPASPILVAGPGTGFGVSTLIPAERGWTVLPGEGGHIAYAPRTDLERQIAAVLSRDHAYVSNELVASGSGLPAVHAAFCELFDARPDEMTPAEMRARADAGDAMYRTLIELRALAVMGAAGDLALANGTLGGVVLAGGVALRIADYLKTPLAFERFASRGPMSGFLANCPVRLLHAEAAPLIGAAAYYAQLKGLSGLR